MNSSLSLKKSFLSIPFLSVGILIFYCFTGCASNPTGPLRPSQSVDRASKQLDSAAAKTPSTDIAPSSLQEKKQHPDLKSIALFYTPHPEGDLDGIIQLLTRYPSLRLTLIFPPNYFTFEGRKSNIDKFRSFQSSGQIEIGLTLDNQPILSLLSDIKQAAIDTANWEFDYAWPEDIAAQIARGSGAYQKKWTQLPSGILPPFFSLSPSVVKALQGFRLHWVLCQPDAKWGIDFIGSMALLVPPNKGPENPNLTSTEPEDVSLLVSDVASHPFYFVDGSRWPDPNTEQAFLRKMAKWSLDHSSMTLLTGRELAERVGNEYPLPKDNTIYKQDHSLWVKTVQQKLAWQALADARNVVERYKNSGQATLPKLDAALEEIYTAESGEFLLALGEAEGSLTSNERNFLATLANVYRLSGVEVPHNLTQWFSSRKWKIIKPEKSPTDRPFFIPGEQSMTWMDPVGDDVGGGEIVYPTGRYEKGTFDLNLVQMSWDETKVLFKVGFEGMSPDNQNIVMPLTDIYVDVNRIPDAGSITLLKQRGGATLNREAAWEYAVSFNPITGHLFQSIPSNPPRKVLTITPVVNSSSKTIEVTLPRQALRGDPAQWRLTVVVMGSDTRREGTELTPVAVNNQPNSKSFGGAQPGRQAPPFIDILAETIEGQKTVLGAYLFGNPVTLPFVEVP